MHYVTSDDIGITRKRYGKHFKFYFANGKEVTNETTLKRIKALAIPPAYTDVWICKRAHGHIQAYGFDDQHRKQYIYHDHWTQAQSKKKFSHLIEFAEGLPNIRKIVVRGLQKKVLSKENMLAAVVRLLDLTSIRIGSPQYESYGLLTLRKKHLTIQGRKVELDFLGKSKQVWHLEIHDAKIQKILKACMKEPGLRIFKYFHDGKLCHLSAADVNHYLQTHMDREITAKEFRTWRASSYFIYLSMRSKLPCGDVGLKQVIADTAKYMWNTPAVCKNSYIHPLLMKLYKRGFFKKYKRPPVKKFMMQEEVILLNILKQNA